MAELGVTITRHADEHQPGWVECEFADADGELHRFFEKGPVVSGTTLSAASSYPRAGSISCRIEEEWGDHTGLDLARIVLDLTQDGERIYIILASDLR